MITWCLESPLTTLCICSVLEKLKVIQKQVLNDWNGWRPKKEKEEASNGFRDLTESKQRAINDFLSQDEGDGLKEKFRKNFLRTVIPKASKKKFLMSHSSENKEEANIIYELLLFCGFGAGEIIFTTSDDTASRIPADQHLLEYIRQFFVQDWWPNPYIFFVLSHKFKESWFTCLEAGATWVTRSDHSIMVLNRYSPEDPLNPKGRLYLNLPENIDTISKFDEKLRSPIPALQQSIGAMTISYPEGRGLPNSIAYKNGD